MNVRSSRADNECRRAQNTLVKQNGEDGGAFEDVGVSAVAHAGRRRCGPGEIGRDELQIIDDSARGGQHSNRRR